MNDYFNTYKRSFYILLSLFFVLAIVLFFAFVRPLMTQVTTTEEQVTDLEASISMLQEKIDSYNVTDSEMTIDERLFHNKIPDERHVDDYILSLQKLEAVSDSQINQIEFVYDSQLDMMEQESEATDMNDDVTRDTGEEDDEENELVVEDNEGENEEDIEDGEIQSDLTVFDEMPDNLQLITVQIDAVSPDYDAFINFIETIEKQERISIVTHLSMDLPTEEDLVLTDDPLEEIEFTVELTTFYYEN